MNNEIVSILVCTWNNPQQLMPMLQSLIRTNPTAGLFHIYVINNGEKESVDFARQNPLVTVIDCPENLGWEGGLIEGMKHAKGEYILLCNDDVHFISANRYWLHVLLNEMGNPKVGAVGPSSNVVMGPQNIFHDMQAHCFEVPYLIGFCMLVRRFALDLAGGIQETDGQGGDDVDLSIRLRKAGYTLLVNRESFVYHHGFGSGPRKHGAYYNSAEMTEKTNHFLIRKHGLKEFFNTYYSQPDTSIHYWEDKRGSEQDVIKPFITGKVVELGVGPQKTVPEAIGVDMIPEGHPILSLGDEPLSVADVVADVSGPLPFSDGEFDTLIARHVLEHIVDTNKTIEEWSRIVKPGGRMIIAVPDHELRNTIPLNHEHVHAFTKESLKRVMNKNFFMTIGIVDSNNGIGFVGVFEKTK